MKKSPAELRSEVTSRQKCAQRDAEEAVRLRTDAEYAAKKKVEWDRKQAEWDREDRRRERRWLRRNALDLKWAEDEKERRISLLIRSTHFGPNDEWPEETPIGAELAAKIDAANHLAEELFHARIDYREYLENETHGDDFARGMEHIRRADARYERLLEAWTLRWERRGATTPPRCNDAKLLAHIETTIAFFRSYAPELYRTPPQPDGGSVPSPKLAPIAKEIERGVKKAHGANWYSSPGRQIRGGRRENLVLDMTEGTSAEGRRPREPVLMPRRGQPAKVQPTPIQKRMARRDEMETRLLGAIRAHPGLALGALEKLLRVKSGTMSGVLDRLLSRGDVENLGKPNRPKYFEIQ